MSLGCEDEVEEHESEARQATHGQQSPGPELDNSHFSENFGGNIEFCHLLVV